MPTPPTIHPLPSISPDETSPPAHWVSNPPTHFQNPWPSFNKQGASLYSVLQTRFGKGRNWVPVPDDPAELVQVRRPDWGRTNKGWEGTLKSTWLGHAGFVVELPVPGSEPRSGGGRQEGTETRDTGIDGVDVVQNASLNGQTERGAQIDGLAPEVEAQQPSTSKRRAVSFRDTNEGANEPAKRGITLLLDAVFADRMSPVSFAGPKRFTQPPCTASELPPIDIVLISHSHYDHLDYETVKEVYVRNKGRVHFFAGLGMKKWFLDNLADVGMQDGDVSELDWWDQVEVSIDLGLKTNTISGAGEQATKARVRLTCCPSQHNSGRTPFDHNKTLWCSWAIQDLPSPPSSQSSSPAHPPNPSLGSKSLYFAGDTALASQSTPSPTPCPAFSQIGHLLGPFTLSLLPIGCFNPRAWMSNVHASPSDSLEIHKLVRSERSLGMHYGTIRGGISGFYEKVGDPEKGWREVAELEGVWWDRRDGKGEGIGLAEIGETVVV